MGSLIHFIQYGIVYFQSGRGSRRQINKGEPITGIGCKFPIVPYGLPEEGSGNDRHRKRVVEIHRTRLSLPGLLSDAHSKQRGLSIPAGYLSHT